MICTYMCNMTHMNQMCCAHLIHTCDISMYTYICVYIYVNIYKCICVHMYINTYKYDIYVYVQHDAYASDVLRASHPHRRYTRVSACSAYQNNTIPHAARTHAVTFALIHTSAEHFPHTNHTQTRNVNERHETGS